MKKKTIGIILAVIAALGIFVWVSNRTTVTTYQLDEGGLTTEFSFTGIGDRLIEQKTVSSIDYAYLNVTDKALAEETLTAMGVAPQKATGYEMSIEYSDKQATIIEVIDYQKVDEGELATILGTTIDEDDEKGYVSVKERTDVLEEAGAKKVK